MIIHRSNRTEALVDALAEVVATPPDDPFAAETIVVQGRGMARWLGLELARRLGVWANPAFPFPRGLVDDAAAAWLGDAPGEAQRFAPQTLRWAIAAELPGQREVAAFAPLTAYLADDPGGGRRLALAGRIADLFDQYAIFRPEMVRQWEIGGGDDWQAPLWRALRARLGGADPAARATALLGALNARRAARGPFPQRISLFGLSTLPPLYVDVVVALSAHLEVHLFQLSPSREYWGDIASRRDVLRAQRRGGDLEGDALHLAGGHPLLASLGRIGRDFQQVLESRADYQDDERYVEPGSDSALAVLQSDILALRVRQPDERPRLDAADRSITVHACHAPMREVEVLHDQLVALFAADAALAPHDVIVLAPSIEAYAPLIEAVFTSPDRPFIPFRIADRAARATQDVIDAFLRALELLPGRLPAPVVLDLLALAPVRERFAIAAEALDRLRTWVQEAGIRWGADADHRAAEGQPACLENTWRFGLNRLLLGVALPDAAGGLYAETLPYADVEGDDAALLGRFASFVEILLRARNELAAARAPAAWRTGLGTLLAALLASTPASEQEHEAILAALAGLAQQAADGGVDDAIDLDTARRLLADALDQGGAPRGFLTGAVTLCQMVPMRTIPFRVVCLLGLSDGAFPRSRRPLGFDRMAARPRPGDRTPRDDDRYLFLEALLAARQRLLITYVGQSISDNTELPPSAVVSELLDALDVTFDLGADTDARRRMVVRHPLQPFSPEYFRADRPAGLVSFAASHFAGAQALQQPKAEALPFLRQRLAPMTPEGLDLEDLIRFLAHPSRWFLQQRLGLYLSDREALLDAREPDELDNLEEWQLGDRLLRYAREGKAPENDWPLLRAEGLLPLGAPGRALVVDVQRQARAIAAAAPLPTRPAIVLDVAVGAWRLTGSLRELDEHGLVAAQYSKVGGYHELRLWVRHLALNAMTPGATSRLVGRPAAQRKGDAACVVFRPVADALDHLEALLALYHVAHERPPQLFKYASRAYAQALCDGSVAALKAAQKAYGPSDGFGVADGNDAYVAQLHASADAALASVEGDGFGFAALAERIYAPLLAHREDA
ncbi:MAG: exodeoxyribonuclease V subunit gamma [bacterium]